MNIKSTPNRGASMQTKRVTELNESSLPQGGEDGTQEGVRTKRSYVQVENQKRESLIHIMKTQNTTIKKASQALGINYSTAKHIMKKHR